jgi:hypothetical protein
MNQNRLYDNFSFLSQEPKLPFEKMLEVDENQFVNAKALDR